MEPILRLVSFTYWWPVRNVDGFTAEDLERHRTDEYLAELKTMSKDYVKGVDIICGEFRFLCNLLDKPNLHRVIELYEHTIIPSFGHAREFMELVFECTHQPINRCNAKSNHHEAHLSAVEHCLVNDWQGRLVNAHRALARNETKDVYLEKKGIRRLRLGPESDILCDQRDADIIMETDQILSKLFNIQLSRQLRSNARLENFAAAKESLWKARKTLD